MNIYAFQYCTYTEYVAAKDRKQAMKYYSSIHMDFEKLTPKPYVYKLSEAEIIDLQIDTRNIYEPIIIVVDEPNE